VAPQDAGAASGGGAGFEEKSRVTLGLAAEAYNNGDSSGALGMLEGLYSAAETPGESRVKAYLLAARIYNEDGYPVSWAKAREVCFRVLELPNLSETQQTEAREALVPALWNLGEYAEAKRLLEGLVSTGVLTELRLAEYQAKLARIYLVEGACSEARVALEKAGGLLERVTPRDGKVHEGFAEVQLLRGLCWSQEGELEQARMELERVPSLAGQSAASAQTREARLKLSQLGVGAERESVLKVLFIGSSHTLRGNVPYLVEQMAGSAPAGVPRVRAGEHVRTGTGMRVFWEEGDHGFTARGKIASGPWDAVVVETFFKNDRQTLETYARKYAGFVREKGARLILYESPVARATRYPEGFEAFHAENIRLGGLLPEVSIAPSVDAWTRFLGVAPSARKMDVLYADWIHATLEGAYLSACCIYAALTKASPEGLAVPGKISDKDARLFQSIAWNAFKETEAASRR
jgi:tetratricopeptide (TPR) repeat protein